MLIDTYLRQSQPPIQIGSKPIDLRMTGPSARECGPSRLMVVGPVFRTKLTRCAPKPPRPAQILNEQFRLSAHSAGQSKYITGRSDHAVGQYAHAARRSTYLTGRSGAKYIEPNDNDYYLTTHLSAKPPVASYSAPTP
jgi:hypothetical protein